MLLFLSVGCMEKQVPNMVWSGIVWDSGGVNNSYWILLDTPLGNKTKYLDDGDYSFVLDLVYGEFYIFWFFSATDHAGNSVDFELVRVSDEGGNIVWE